jgi:putative acetyltransferase
MESPLNESAGRFALRSAARGDEAAIRSVVDTVLREYGFASEPTGVDADLDDVTSQYRERGGLFRVLVDGAGEIVGCGGLFPLSAKQAEIRKLYFLPRARGLGFGRVLLEDLIAHARSRGFHRVVLETSSRLPGAGVHLYKCFGFADVPRNHLSARADIAMALDLS